MSVGVSAAKLMGIGSIPTSKPGCLAWLKRNRVQPHVSGNTFLFSIADLPAPERQAYLAQCAAESGLSLGNYDDAAHEAFWQAPASMRAEAERKAAIACLLVSIRGHAGWDDRIALVHKRFGSKGSSKQTLKRILSAVKDVDPINYAPALLAGYKSVSAPAAIPDQAWSLFLTILRDAGPDFPIAQAWRDVRDVAKLKRWDWPKYVTINRRWNALPDAQRLAVRYGRDATQKALAQPVHRDKTTIGALEWVSLDGRTKDFWVDMGDGRALRMTMLALVDVASNMVLDYELAASENAVDTARLIRRTCETYGIFDRLYTDNSSAFAGHLVAGGNVHRFRNSAANKAGVQPVGICYHLGINIRFALPGNAQAKSAERTFASFRGIIDDRPEFKGAHAGHNPGAAPDSTVRPVPFETAHAVIRREVKRYNTECGRRSQGAHGRSYQQVFEASLARRIRRKPTARQLYLASLFYRPVSVNRHGQIMVDTWVYGDPDTQAALLPYHGTGKKILLGRDPDDLSADAVAFDEDGRLICEGIHHVARGAYDSVEGKRMAARNRKAARDATAAAELANGYLSDADLNAALAALDDATGSEKTLPAKPAKVVGARFGSPLRDVAAPDRDEAATINPDFYRNMDSALAAKRQRRGKSA